jgi:hypothetical protein
VLKVTVVKDATPPTSLTGVAPPSVHDDVIVTESVDAVSRLPYVSSVFTVNGTAVLAGVVDAGSVVKTTLFAVDGVTVIVAVAVPPVGASVATNAHEPVPAPLRVMPVNVALPEVPEVVYTRLLPLGDRVQFVEDNVMVSPEAAAVKATV